MSPTLVWTLGSYDFIAQSAVPGLLSFAKGWKLGEASPPGRDGVIINTSPKQTGMPFSMSGVFRNTTAAALRTSLDSLKSALNSGRQAFKMFDDRQIYLTVVNFEEIWLPGLQVEFSIDFLADIPFWESVILDTLPGAPTVWTTNTGSVTASNGGNAATPVVITLTVPAATTMTAAVLRNLTTGKYISWTGSLTAGQTLEIDTDPTNTSPVLENGVADVSGLDVTNATEEAAGRTSALWTLNPGSNTLSFDSTPTGATVTVEKRDRWY